MPRSLTAALVALGLVLVPVSAVSAAGTSERPVTDTVSLGKPKCDKKSGKNCSPPKHKKPTKKKKPPA